MNPECWKQIKQLYNAALELEPDLRKAFLEEACGGDDSIRKEVEALLENQPEAENFIESSAMAVAARLAADSVKPVSTSSMEGMVVSHYRVIKKLGQGGMGEVYQAKDLALGRDVAIKVLPEEFANDADRAARFQREAFS
jgi:serine/threonine protein kinase